MLAHHPVTGQPIRIMRTDTQISKDLRTLVWVRPTFKASEKWASRWSAVVSEPDAVSQLADELPVAVILREWSNEWKRLLETWKGKDILLFTSAAAERMLQKEIPDWDQQFVLSELYDMYPFLATSVKDDDPTEKIVVSIAHILRFQRIVWSVSDSAAEYQQKVWKRHCDGVIQVVPEDADAEVEIPQLWLIQQYFKHSLPRRAREVWTCLQKNIACKWIDKILLLNEADDLDLPPHAGKIICKTIGSRLTYADALRAIQTDVPVGSLAIFSNSDIWFDESLRDLWSLPMMEKRLFLALLRWEDEGQIYGPRSDSQDSWIVARDAVDFQVSDDDFGFPFGKPGCDNAISCAMLRKKFVCANPAYSIRTHHMHASAIRNYDAKDILYKPVYLYMDPTAIHPYTVVRDLRSYSSDIMPEILDHWNAAQASKMSFARPILPLKESQGNILVSMINRKENESFRINGKNTWTPPPNKQTLYRFFRSMFVSNNGLLSDCNKIFTGGYEEWVRGWEAANVSSLTPSIHVPFLISVYTPNTDCWKSPSVWVLQYFIHALRIRTAIQKSGRRILPEFLVPSMPQVSAFVEDCVWKEQRMTIVPYMESAQYYSNEVWTASPPGTLLVTQEDIAALRELIPPSTLKNKRKPVLVLCIESDQAVESDEDPHIFTRKWAQTTISCIFRDDQRAKWDIRIVGPNTEHPLLRSAFQDADWIVGCGELLNWMWIARPGTHVLEFQHEMNLTSERIHLAGACGLKYVSGILQREPTEFQQQHAMLDVGLAIQTYGFKENLQTSVDAEELPVVILPEGSGTEGIWSHDGHEFREMAKLWAERGYCRLEASDSPYCWWGGVGEVLLYDRPTPRWWLSVPRLPTYQMALFGAPVPPGPHEHKLRQSVWSYWPRNPRALEAKVENGIPTWSERTIQSVFLGRVENGIQKARRCGQDWSTSVELFSMPVDSTEKEYPYTQEDYLDTLLKARYGLCLAGHGGKSTREIECLACGTVPIFTEAVDSKHFLRPLKEGVHYFFAKTPADVQRIVETTPQEKWEAMSAAGRKWWRENASAEGLFRLTWSRIEQCRPFFAVGIPPVEHH